MSIFEMVVLTCATPLLQGFILCVWMWIRLPSGLPWRAGPHIDAEHLLFWLRTAPAWKEIYPLTPACHEIIEPCSVPDCTLTWCNLNLFHSLIRRFECRKGTNWAVTGGMTSMLLLSCLCHWDFEWSDFSADHCQVKLQWSKSSKTKKSLVGLMTFFARREARASW